MAKTNEPVRITPATRMIAALRGSTKADLDELDTKIEDMEAQLKGLRILREVLAERVLNAPEPVQTSAPGKGPTPAPGATPADRENLKHRVGTWLAAHGPGTPAEIGKALSIDGRAVTSVLLGNRDLFLRDDDGWVITQEGRKRWGSK